MSDIKLYWEDIEIGKTIHFGQKIIDEEEMVAFASEYDPQPHHLDHEAAKRTVFGGLSATGWYSSAVLMRLVCDHVLKDSSSMGSPGIRESKWLTAVRPGDILTGRYTCRAKYVSSSRPEIGVCDILFELVNQSNHVVMNWDCISFFGRRYPEEQPDPHVTASPRLTPFRTVKRIPGNHLIKYFDFIDIGDQLDLGSYEFTAERVKAFAARFDPQPFHVDEEAAKLSLFGELCASGWHTASVWMRQMVNHYVKSSQELASLGRPTPRLGPSLGFKNMCWHKPVYAGDVISYRSWAQRKRELHANKGWGLLMIGSEGINQNNDVVFSFFNQVYMERSRES